MVKTGGGTKRKIPMKKIENKESLAVAFTKRSYGLHSKASELCLLSGGQIAVLATPVSSNSNASFYSFGHSSVDAVVSAFLSGQRPVPVREETREEDLGICLARKHLGLGMWWEDELLAGSENPEELTEAINSMSSLLAKCKELRKGESFCNHYNHRRDLEKSEPDQTLIPQSDSPICRMADDIVAAFSPSNHNNEITEEQSQILALCESFCVTEEEENNNKDMALTRSLDQEMDIDELIDFETAFDIKVFDDWLLDQEETTGMNSQDADDDASANPSPISDSQGFEDRAFDTLAFENWLLESNQEESMGALDQDNLCFSDLFNTIAAGCLLSVIISNFSDHHV